jgi:hypothetical protein
MLLLDATAFRTFLKKKKSRVFCREIEFAVESRSCLIFNRHLIDKKINE